MTLDVLRCPTTGEALHVETGCLVSTSGRVYPVHGQPPCAYADFTAQAEADSTRELQRAVYDSPESRYFQEGAADKARFMRAFVEQRVQRRVKSKDSLLVEGLARLPLGPSARVLEIGCNDGRWLNVVTAMQGCRGVGIDLSASAIGQAVQARPEGCATEFHVANACPLPFVDGAFDAIVSFDVFEHLGRGVFERTTQECARVLRPGGTLLVYVVSRKDEYTLHETLRSVTAGRVGIDRDEGHAWENFVHPDQFRAAARDVGLKVEDLRAYHGFWTLFADEHLGGALPRMGYALLEWLDRPLVNDARGNGFLVRARR